MLSYLIKNNVFSRFFRQLLERILWLPTVLKLDQWIISGKEITSKQHIIFLYAGNKKYPENKNFIIKLAFDASYQERPIGTTWLWARAATQKKTCPDCDMMIMEVPQIFRVFFRKSRCFYLPTWFDGKVDCTSPITCDSTKTDMKRIKKNSLHFAVTNAEHQFKEFYYYMHIPYISKTFGDRAFIHNYNHMIKNFSKHGLYNDLLLVEKNGECIAGILLGYVKEEIYLHYVGVKDGNFEYVQDGALGALFYFPIEYAKEKGYRTVNFGLTRPFLNDGVLQFKKKRGMQIADTFGMGFQMRPMSNSVAVKAFLANNPFLYLVGDKMYGAVFVDGDQPLSQENIKRIYKDNYLGGMQKLIIYSLGESCPMIDNRVPSEMAEHLCLRSAGSYFKK